MITHFLSGTLAVVSISALGAAEFKLHSFEKKHLSEHFWGEGANFGDFNKDGHNDIVSGPFWYEGPNFTERHEYYPANKSFQRKKADGTEEAIPGFEGALGARNTYSDNFFAFVHDFNNDSWPDILIAGFPGVEAFWFKNPQGKSAPWERFVTINVVDNESPTFGDLTGDGKPELICGSEGYLGYATPDWNNPEAPWTFHRVTPKGPWQRFTHGLGFGDVNGDGRNDLLEATAWWEQPEQAGQLWTKHPQTFGVGGAQMYVYDVDGDGDNDVISSLAAHGYGLAWFEHIKEGGEIRFKEHIFMNKEPNENRYGVQFSQLHAIDLADMNGDGLMDIVTGKRFWAHGPTGDPEPGAPAVLYWFELKRTQEGVDFVPHLIDDDSGVGTQVVAGDINGDGHPDIVVGNKKGTYVHLHQVKNVSKADWEKAQPKPVQSKTGAAIESRPGIVPQSADGRALNLGFESGDLTDWKAEGAAFQRQPIKGDTVNRRRGDMSSQHDGEFWLGGYEIAGDDPQGTLTSAPFKATQPFASFLVAGGPWPETRVELVRADNGEVFFKTSGYENETLRPVVVDLQKLQNQNIFIRVVDERGGHWGHVNFDDFKFHAQRPKFDNELDVKQLAASQIPPVDVVQFAGLSPQEAADAITAPQGFKATVFAAEPHVQQPIGFTIDDRGRLWVAEAFNYPLRAPEGEGKDRVLVFEDTNGDGQFDERTVFIENLNLVSGIEVGFGGVWIGAAPYLLFIPDADHDAKPDGEPIVMLDGWAWQDTHETLNTFIWGPDGWLYGCHGVFTHSNVGKPGAPDSERTKINAGVWRFHPTKHKFEVFAEGTSNPWGVDFDEYGQCFIEACVIPHLFHMIQGARYQRQAGQHFNPYIYEDIKTIADHVHWAGDRGPHAANSRSDSAGGGHAHAGLMVYLGDSWPSEYRGKLFMNNIHGQRLNMDIAERSGSGFVGRHGEDFLNFNDQWSQVLNLRYDHDGSVYIIDWYDQNQCHHRNVDGHDRSNGRIFKLTYNGEERTPVDLAKKSDLELAELQLHKNDWFVRHARRLLQERAANGNLNAQAIGRLQNIASSNNDPTRRLRALWALHVTGHLSEEQALKFLQDDSEYIRGWAIQLAAEDNQLSAQALEKLASLAKGDPSPLVRLYIASALQRVPPEDRWPILNNLVAHEADKDDHNLPFLYWYAAEASVGQDTTKAVQLLAKSKIPRLRQFITRRMAAGDNVASR